MISKLTHFAIYVEDMERASQFYKEVFGWVSNSYGPPDFQQLKSDGSEKGELIGALQHRKYSLTSEKVIGFECSISVENIDTTTQIVEKAGGKILMPKTEIPQVGWVIKFQDTEGNIVCAIQYHNHILAYMNQ